MIVPEDHEDQDHPKRSEGETEVEAPEVLDRGPDELDPGCGSELVEGGGLPIASLLESELRSLERLGDPVEDLNDVVRIDVRPVDRVREERPRERALPHVSPLHEPGELGRVLLVQRDSWRSPATGHPFIFEDMVWSRAGDGWRSPVVGARSHHEPGTERSVHRSCRREPVFVSLPNSWPDRRARTSGGTGRVHIILWRGRKDGSDEPTGPVIFSAAHPGS